MRQITARIDARILDATTILPNALDFSDDEEILDYINENFEKLEWTGKVHAPEEIIKDFYEVKKGEDGEYSDYQVYLAGLKKLGIEYDEAACLYDINGQRGSGKVVERCNGAGSLWFDKKGNVLRNA